MTPGPRARGLLCSSVLLLLGVVQACSGDVDTDTVRISDAHGVWEGEVETDDRPTFLTFTLTADSAAWTGTLTALGNTFAFEDVEVVGSEVRAVLVAGPEGFTIAGSIAGDRLTGAVIEAGERHPLTLLRVPDHPEPRDRVEAWRQDLEALDQRFLTWDRSFSPDERAEFRRRIEDLHDQVPSLHDDEIVMRMASAVALSENAHTRLYLLRNRTALRRLPVRLWWFADGLRVVRATDEHADLVGCRVRTLGGRPAAAVRDSVARAFAGNPSWTAYKSVYYMTSPEALHGFRLVATADSVRIGLDGCPDGRGAHTLRPLPLEPSDDAVEAWWDLSPRHEAVGWVSASPAPEQALPLYLRHPDRHYWFEILDDAGLLYVQYNRAAEMSDETLADFGARLQRELEMADPRTVVVDLRFNTGGDAGLARDLMATLEEATRGRQRFVVTGRATFSAGVAHAAAWVQAGDVTVIGEPVGDELDYWSEGGNITLPNSGLDAHFGNGFHSYSASPCPEDAPCVLDLTVETLEPDIRVHATWADYVEGVDPVLNSILGR